MNTNIEYHVVKGDLSSLVDEVNLRIKDGWIPLGGISYNIAPNTTSLVCLQAMVKDKEWTTNGKEI